MGTLNRKLIIQHRGDGIKKRNFSLFRFTILCIILIANIFNYTAIATEEVSLSINIIDQEPHIDQGRYVIVADIWNDIIVSYDTQKYDSISLTIFKGKIEPIQQNFTNFFSWTYNKINILHWQSDTVYGAEYLQSESCLITDTFVKFRVGIKDTLPDEIFYQQFWTLQVKVNNVIIHSEEIIVEKPTRGFAKSHGDHISFQVDPFTSLQAKASDYIILKNTGNVPLEISLTYDALDNYLEYIEQAKTISPYCSQTYSTVLNAPSWQPQRIEKTGLATAKAPSSIIIEDETSGSSISLKTALVIDPPPIHIFVGHSTHVLETLNEKTGFSFQYSKSITIKEGETKTLNAYVSGEGTATIAISVNKNLNLKSIRLNGNELNTPLKVTSLDDKEQVISFDIQSISENNDGVVYYSIETEGETQTFSTNVQVIMPIIEYDDIVMQGTSIITVFVIIVLILVGAYMLYNHLVYGRRG